MTWILGQHAPPSATGGSIGGSTGATDNRLIRADGVGGATIQSSSITVDDDGDITAFGGQIAFPATQNASADANTLDDYEEGTWTPALTFSTPGDLSITYGSQIGDYRKIGSMVFAPFVITTSAFTHTTASGSFRVTGLPFTISATAGEARGSLGFGGWTKANYTMTSIQTPASQTYAEVVAFGSGVGAANMTAADIPTGVQKNIGGQTLYVV